MDTELEYAQVAADANRQALNLFGSLLLALLASDAQIDCVPGQVNISGTDDANLHQIKDVLNRIKSFPE